MAVGVGVPLGVVDALGASSGTPNISFATGGFSSFFDAVINIRLPSRTLYFPSCSRSSRRLPWKRSLISMSGARLACCRARDLRSATGVVASVLGGKVRSYVFLPWRSSMDSEVASGCERANGDHDENMVDGD